MPHIHKAFLFGLAVLGLVARLTVDLRFSVLTRALVGLTLLPTIARTVHAVAALRPDASDRGFIVYSRQGG